MMKWFRTVLQERLVAGGVGGFDVDGQPGPLRPGLLGEQGDRAVIHRRDLP